MDRFSIKEIEILTGIKAHTLRIWEKRYGIIQPLRTETNIRYFSDEQLRKILNISTLNKAGVKISKISKLTEKQLVEEIKWLTQQRNHNVYFDRLTLCMFNYDPVAFNEIFADCLQAFGLTGTVNQILFPFLNQVGLMWGNKEILPSNEHFISHQVRQKLFAEIDNITLKPEDSGSVVLFLPQHEFHEIGLLFAYYNLKSLGKNAIYLGSNVPDQSLEECCAKTKPAQLVTYFSSGISEEDLDVQLKIWAKMLPKTTIYFAGNRLEFEQKQIPENCIFLSNMEELVAAFS